MGAQHLSRVLDFPEAPRVGGDAVEAELRHLHLLSSVHCGGLSERQSAVTLARARAIVNLASHPLGLFKGRGHDTGWNSPRGDV